MKLPPAYLFPTTTVLIDDDFDFMDALQRKIKPNTTVVKKFDTQKKALKLLEDMPNARYWQDSWVTSYASENDFESVAIEVKFPKICSILNDPNRINQITTIVVDYKMPEVDGLTFLESIKDLPVKKILLTGVNDAEIAVKAIDRGLIKDYLRKHDPDLVEKLEKIILRNQLNHFQKRTSVINLATKFAKVNNERLDAAYLDIFNEIKIRHNAIEHYLMDENGSCMFINSESERLNLIIKTMDQLSSDNHVTHEKEMYTPLLDGSNFFYNLTTRPHDIDHHHGATLDSSEALGI